MTDDSPPKTNIIHRGAERVQCRSTGEMRLDGENHVVSMLDVSSGGCKFRIAGLADSDFPYPIPVEFEMTFGGTSLVGAIIWVVSGMFGSRFYEHILLDDVANILSGGFRIRILPTMQTPLSDESPL